MELSNWAPEHSDALREFIAKGLSFSEAAQAINSRFNTSYTRSAALGRARRLRLEADDRQKPSLPTKPVDLHDIAEPCPSASRAAALLWPTPVFKEAKPVKLRCVALEPRHLGGSQPQAVRGHHVHLAIGRQSPVLALGAWTGFDWVDER